MKSIHLKPEDCGKCKLPRYLNVIQFNCSCTGRTHTYMAHQFPVYKFAPQIFRALKLSVSPVTADKVGGRLKRILRLIAEIEKASK